MFKRVTVLVAFALFALVGSAHAQGTQLSAGVKAGLDLADLDGPGETDMKLGFSGGAFLGVQLHEYFAVEILGQYVRKGAKAPAVDTKTKLDYIEFMAPLTLTIPLENGPVSPRIFAGPALALEMSCKVGNNGSSTDCEDPTKSVDFGVAFGGGVDFMVGSGAVTFDALYNLGLRDIQDVEGAMEEIKNRNIQFLLGYRLFFGG